MSMRWVLIVVALLGFAVPAMARETRTHEVRAEDGTPLHVWEAVGPGPAVLAILRGWHEPFLSALPTSRFLTVDPRSRGRSGAAPSETITLDQDVADLLRVCDALGLERVHLIGASYYGGVMAAFAARHPERVLSLTLVGAIPLTQAELFGYAPPARAGRADPQDVAALAHADSTDLATRDPLAHCRLYRRTVDPTLIHDLAQLAAVPDPCPFANEWPANFGRWAGALFGQLGEWDFRGWAPGIQVPTLVLHGREDLISPPSASREWVERIPGARWVEIPEAGHVIWYEKPAEVFGRLSRFLGGEWPDDAVAASGD